MSEMENKLDEDFLFYLGFTNGYINRIAEPGEISKCRAWLQKLCGAVCPNKESKRNRNIFLSHLVLCMQDKKLTGPFQESPNDVDLTETSKYFGELQQNLQAPSWLDELGARDDDKEGERDNGRTYVATRTMPAGQGAFAYVAISLAEEEPKWLGGGEGAFEAHMKEKFREFVPEQTEMEKILARRKNPKERERVITFYDILLQNISDEMDGVLKEADNDTVNGLMEQLINDLKSKGLYADYQNMDEKERRTDLLLMLHDRVYSRREKVKRREEVLDNIEATLPKSFFDASILEQDKYEMPSLMWEQAINKAPMKKHMNQLNGAYPNLVIKKFLLLLSNQKEEMAMRMQKRHDNIVAQMKKELRSEGEKLVKWVDEGRIAMERALDVLKCVTEARKKQEQAKFKQDERKKKSVETEKTALYEEMRNALYDHQQKVENEADIGRCLTEEINHLNAQSEIMHQVTNDNLLKKEEANITIMRNIKRIRLAIQQYEGRLMQLQAISMVRQLGDKHAQEREDFFIA